MRIMYKIECYDNIYTRPPKAPCWTDFVSIASTSNTVNPISTSDLHKNHKNKIQFVPGETNVSTSVCHSKFDGLYKPSPTAKPRKLGKAMRPKLHRTQSEARIRDEDLPQGSLIMNLCETNPRELGVRMQRRGGRDNRLYDEENVKRCQNWLATVEASHPLHEVHFTTDSDRMIEQREDLNIENKIDDTDEQSDIYCVFDSRINSCKSPSDLSPTIKTTQTCCNAGNVLGTMNTINCLSLSTSKSSVNLPYTGENQEDAMIL